MPGIAWSGGGNFSNASGATTTIGTFPSGSYGPTPVLLVLHGAASGISSAASYDYDVHIGGTHYTIANSGLGSVKAVGRHIGWATFFNEPYTSGLNLDAGGTVGIKTIGTSTPAEVGAAVAAIVTFGATRAHDQDQGLVAPAGTSGTWAGHSFSGAMPGTNIDPANLHGDGSAECIAFVAGVSGDAGTYAPDFTGDPAWSNVRTQQNGGSFASLGLWTRPTPLDLSYSFSAVPAADGVFVILGFIDFVTNVFGRARSYGTIIG